MKSPVLFGALLVLVAVLAHLQLFRALPDPFMQPDTVGFLQPALDLIERGHLSLSTYRTPGYSLFLSLVIGLTQSLFVVVVLQTVILFVTGVVVGWLTYEFVKNSFIAMTVGALVVVWPRAMIYAHTLLSDNLYTAVFSTTLLLFFVAQRKDWRWFALPGFLCFLSMFIRPVGYALTAALVLSFLWIRIDNRGRAWGVFMAALLIPVSVWFLVNLSTRGLSGLTGENGEMLFSSSAYLLELDDPALSDDVRTVLLPIYARPDTRPRLWRDRAWLLYHPEGPTVALKQTHRFKTRGDRLLRELGGLAIRQHPFLYARGLADNLWGYIRNGSRRPEHLIPKHIALFRGVEMFWMQTQDQPSRRSLLHFRPESAEAYVQRVSDRNAYPFERQDVLSTLLWPLTGMGAWLPALALFSALVLMAVSPLRRSIATLALIIFLHFLMSSMPVGVDGRYTMPIDPLYLVITACFLHLCAAACRRALYNRPSFFQFFRRLRRNSG